MFAPQPAGGGIAPARMRALSRKTADTKNNDTKAGSLSPFFVSKHAGIYIVSSSTNFTHRNPDFALICLISISCIGFLHIGHGVMNYFD
jgi:hypothetical protein